MATTSAAMEPLAIGIDIGGTGTKFGIVDRVGKVWVLLMVTIIQALLNMPQTFLGRALFLWRR